MIDGYYYLHENGALIYKREVGDTSADLRESTFVRAFWPVDVQDRAGAWRILIEATAAGASLADIQNLAAKWRCDDADAAHYAAHVGCRLYRDGDQWCATRNDFENLQESPAGFGRTCLDALAALAKELGYRPQKMWGNSFARLLRAPKIASAG
jgi:hypothetical protein